MAPRLVAAGATVQADGDGALMVSGLEPAAIGDIAFQAGVPVHELAPQEASLEEAFMELTRDDVEFHARQHTEPRHDANDGHAQRPVAGPGPNRRAAAGVLGHRPVRVDEDADSALDADHAGRHGVYRDRPCRRSSRWPSCRTLAHSGVDARRHPLTIIQSGWGLGLLAFEVLGVLVVTNEYSSGLIAETLLATPRRLRVLLAKVVVFVVLVFVVAEVMSFVNFFVGHAVISAYQPFPNVALTDHNVLRAVVGEGIDAALVGLIGLAIGAILRHTAGAITASVAVLFVLPLVLMALPTSWEQPVEEYWPTEAGSQLEQVTRQAHALTAWWGTGDLALFVLVLLVIAGYALVKRRLTSPSTATTACGPAPVRPRWSP